MLNKLLKYEIKATARTFLPLYVLLLVFAGINQLISSLSPEGWGAPAVISMILYITILIGMLVMTLIVMIQRFYKNLLSDEGYLMFTLPTKPWKHITSKLLVSMMWTAISGLVAVLSIYVIAMNQISLPELMQSLSDFWKYAHALFGSSTYLLVLEVILSIIVSLASGILIVYASIAMGHLWNEHKILGSIGSFLFLNTITQILFAIASTLSFLKQFMNFSENITPFSTPAELSFVHYFMWFCIIFYGILTAGFYAITNIILSRRLNLE